jgi:HK97 family phage prohead protease
MSDIFTKSIELKAEEFANGEIVAYLSTFGNKDRVGDIVEKGAFDEFVSNFDPSSTNLPMLFNHNNSNICGKWNKLEIDDYGLKGYGTIFKDTMWGKEAYSLLNRGILGSVSIGYRVHEQENDGDTRYLKQISLVETSIVLNPANELAKVISVKSDDGFIEVKSLKNVLRDAGLNRREIDALLMGGFSQLKNIRNQKAEVEEVVSVMKGFKF